MAHRTHTNEPVPFLIYKPGVMPDDMQTLDEDACKAGSYGLLQKDEFMNALMDD